MDSELNLRLLGMMHQISYLMQTQEKFRGQGRLLVLLSQYGALTQRELIELTGRRSATLSEQLDGMEKSGLISRCKNEQDKRNVDVELTEQGKKTAIEALQNRQAYADELFDTIPQRKKQQLAGLLDSLLHTWDIPINEEEYRVPAIRRNKRMDAISAIFTRRQHAGIYRASLAVFRDEIAFFDAENAGVDQNAGLEVDDHAGLQNAFVAGRDRGRLRAHEAHAMAHTAVPLCRGRTPVLLPELCQRRTDRAKEFSQRHPQDPEYRTGKLG